jgi:hypothetical protein
MTFQRILPPNKNIMPKQDETITLTDPDTGETMQLPTSIIKNHIELRTVVGEMPTGSALKFDDGKLPFHLLSTEAMNQTAAVLAFGAEKYAEHNWRKGFVWSRPLSAAMRHITAFNAGEDKDPESGLSHLAHAACCIMFLLEFEKTHKELDDRYKP